jgi:hypothetical protein
LIEVRQGDSVPLLRKYDLEGRLVRERDPSDDRRFTWSDGRLTKVESSANGTSILGWDSSGRLKSSTVGESVTTYKYEDSMWSPTQVTTAGGTTSGYSETGKNGSAMRPATNMPIDSTAASTGRSINVRDRLIGCSMRQGGQRLHRARPGLHCLAKFRA